MDEELLNGGRTGLRADVRFDHLPPPPASFGAGGYLVSTDRSWELPATPTAAGASRRASVYVLIVVASIVVIAASTVGAYFFVDRGEDTFGARAEIRFDLGTASTPAQIDRLIASQSVVARSRGVLEPVAAATGTPIDELEAAFKAEIVGSSSIMRLTVESPDPAEALRLVEAAAQSYIAEVHRTSTSDAEAFLLSQIQQATDEQTAITERLLVLESERTGTVLGGAPPVSTEEELLRRRAANLDQRLGILQERLVDVQLHQREEPTAVMVGSPYVLDDPVGMKPSQAAAFGALVGIVIAASIAVAIWQLSEPR